MLREQLARLEAVVDTQVNGLDVGLGNAVESNSTLSIQLAEAILMLESQRDRMETLEKTFEERMEELREKVLDQWVPLRPVLQPAFGIYGTG